MWAADPARIREGHQIFAEELRRFADRDGRPRIEQISIRLAQPLSVDVRGRRGVGVSSVADALASSGVRVVAGGADVVVLVIAEVAKPEDLDVLRAVREPVMIVLNKADLAGSGPGGPVATAHRRAEELRALTGVPVVPMVALLARAAPTPQQLTALQVLAVEPADLSSPDAFVAKPHRSSREVRAELLATLDRFGIAHAVLAVSRGAEAAAVADRLCRLSEVDRAMIALDAVAAPVRYQRVRRAIAELRAVGGDRVGRFLAADDTVIAVMAAAVDVVAAAGLQVDRGCDARAHLRRARRWQHYSDGPVDALHRNCGADIVRGSLRLLGQAT